MPHGGYHGVVKMGGVTVQQGSSLDDKGEHKGGGVYNPGGYANDFDTGQPGDASNIIEEKLSPTNKADAQIINALNAQEEPPVVKNEEITGLPSGGILQALYGGGAGSIEGYDPKDPKYNLEGQHPLSQQFVRLADKYYGGDQEAFAQSSQGQVLLNYLQDVPYTKGGLLGLPTQELEEKLAGLDLDIFDEDILMGEDYEPFKTKNIPVGQIRNQPDLNRLGPLSSEDYKKFNEFLYATRPDLYAKARPFSSGKLPASIIKFLMSPTTEFGKGIANSLLNLAGKDPLKEKEPFKGLATDNQFIDQLNYEGFPLDSNLSALIQPLDTNQGGMNDVAQAVINQNVTPVIDPALDPLITAQLLEENLPEGGINTFDPDSFAFT
tara:strand:- start:117 stop:1256 length:1140 start_codon:yes stop_codon:yes gene_type:complete